MGQRAAAVSARVGREGERSREAAFARQHRLSAQGVNAVKKLVSMRAALGDDDLLGKALRGSSWSAWRTILIAIMGERLTDDERKVWSELTGGREVEPLSPADESFICVGRRSGKTQTAATAAVYLAALCDHSSRLAAGERATLP